VLQPLFLSIPFTPLPCNRTNEPVLFHALKEMEKVLMEDLEVNPKLPEDLSTL
jgi:hypothetical protein